MSSSSIWNVVEGWRRLLSIYSIWVQQSPYKDSVDEIRIDNGWSLSKYYQIFWAARHCKGAEAVRSINIAKDSTTSKEKVWALLEGKKKFLLWGRRILSKLKAGNIAKLVLNSALNYFYLSMHFSNNLILWYTKCSERLKFFCTFLTFVSSYSGTNLGTFLRAV